MKALRDYLAGHGELLFEALELATCGFYLRAIDLPADDPAAIRLSRAIPHSLGYDPIERSELHVFWSSLVHPDEVARVTDVHRMQTGQDDVTTLDYRMRRSDGTYRYTRETGRVITPDDDGMRYWLATLLDIDQQTRAEQKLANQHDELQTILDTIPTYIWFKDKQHRILRTNRAAAEASGMTVEQIEGRLTHEVYPESGNQYVESDLQLIRTERPVQNRHEQLRSTTGETRQLVISKYEVRDVNGGEPRILVVGSDVTDVEGAKLALEKSEAQFRELFDSSPLGMLLVNSEGIIKIANGEAARVFGYERHALEGRTIETLVPESRRGRHQAHRSQYTSQERKPRGMGDGHEFEGVRQDGTRVLVEVALSPVEFDDDTLTLASVVDVTERARTQRQLKLASEVGDVGFWEWDLQTQAVTVTPSLLKQLGRDEPWTSAEDFRTYAHPDDYERVLQHAQDYFEGRVSDYEVVFRLRHADGDYRWILSRGTKILDESGVAVQAIGFHIDITDQHRTQLVLQEKTKELERSNYDLDRFAYVASHDLKAPLRGIQHLTDWIVEDLGDDLEPQINDHVNLLKAQVSRMESLLDDLLAYSRIGRESHRVESIDMNTMVQDLFQFMGPSPKLKLVIPKPLPVIESARGPLEQVLRNLIGNAIIHGIDGNQITVTAEQDGAMIRVGVADQGPGIEPEFHNKIFEMFQRLSSAGESAGTGMGLSLVRRLSETYGGQAWVESKPNEGAKFCFTWPQRISETESATTSHPVS